MSDVCRGRLLGRQFVLLAVLSSDGYKSLVALARKTGVSVRTIRRDLASLEEAHFAVVDLKCDDGVRRFKLQRGARCPLCRSMTEVA